MLATMRAGRLVVLLRLLQTRGRLTARQLATELEVSVRTVLRDVEVLSGAGVPIYAVRGPQGGFELLRGPELRLPALPSGSPSHGRARIRLSPHGRRVAAVLGRPAEVQVRRRATGGPPGREDWVEASIRVDSVDAGVDELVALGAEVEVVHPPELRARLAEVGRLIAAVNA